MTLWSWGANSHGQTGQGEISEQIQKPTILCDTPWNKIKKISCGGGHTLLIDSDGKLYACGGNDKYQLGFECKTIAEFQRVWDLSGIHFTNICCGWDFSCGVSNDKILLVWGSNSHGQLGLPRSHFPSEVKPKRLQVNACHIAMGLRHTAIINSKGEVWVTGCGRHGQLGLGEDVITVDKFSKVSSVSKITNISCGQNFTIAWSANDKLLYVWGDNRHGQLLLNIEKYPKIFLPQKIDIDLKSDVKELLCGWTNVCLLLSDGKLMTWGRNTYGQLGIENSKLESMNEVQLPNNCSIIDVAVGSEHTVCIASDFTLWSWGWNEHSNTGIDNTIDCINKPTQLELNVNSKYKVTSVFAGGGHNFINVNIENECKETSDPELETK